MRELKNRYFESRFLPNSFLKSISFVPKVYVMDLTGRGVGGWYMFNPHNEPYICKHSGNEIHLKPYESYIMIDENTPYLESTLAHELKHFEQKFNKKWKMGSNYVNYGDSQEDYEASIKRYFYTYIHEKDALLFEYRHAKNETNEYWMDICKFTI